MAERNLDYTVNAYEGITELIFTNNQERPRKRVFIQ